MLYCQLWTMLYCQLLYCQLWTMLSTRLFSHDNVVTALFNHQYCCKLLTRLSNNENDNVIDIVFSCFNNRKQPLLLHQCSTTLFVEQHCSAMITVSLRHCSTTDAITTCANFSCVETRSFLVENMTWLLFRRRMTPLHCAALEGEVKVAKVLVEVGASSRCFDEEGMAPHGSVSIWSW